MTSTEANAPRVETFGVRGQKLGSSPICVKQKAGARAPLLPWWYQSIKTAGVRPWPRSILLPGWEAGRDMRWSRTGRSAEAVSHGAVSYTHLRAHETPEHLVCRLLLE